MHVSLVRNHKMNHLAGATLQPFIGDDATHLGGTVFNHYILYPILQVPHGISLLPVLHNPTPILFPTNLSHVEQLHYGSRLAYAPYEEMFLQELQQHGNRSGLVSYSLEQQPVAGPPQRVFYYGDVLLPQQQNQSPFWSPVSCDITTAPQNLQQFYAALEHSIACSPTNYAENTLVPVPLYSNPGIPMTGSENLLPHYEILGQNCHPLQFHPTGISDRVTAYMPRNLDRYSTEIRNESHQASNFCTSKLSETTMFGIEKVEEWLLQHANVSNEQEDFYQQDHGRTLKYRSLRQETANAQYQDYQSKQQREKFYDTRSKRKEPYSNRVGRSNFKPVELGESTSFAVENKNILAFASSSLNEWGLIHPMGIVVQQKSQIECCFRLTSGAECYVKIMPSGIRFSCKQKGISYLVDEAGVRTCFGSFKSAQYIARVCTESTQRIRSNRSACFVDARHSNFPFGRVREGFQFIAPSPDMERFIKFVVKDSSLTAKIDGPKSGHLYLKTYLSTFRQIIYCNGFNVRLTFHTQTAYINANGELSLSELALVD